MEWDIEKISTFSTSELSAFLSQLIETDQSALLQLLYRLDVDEDRIRSTLESNPYQPAGDMLAQLILERLAQRAEARKRFTPTPPSDIPEDERW